MFSLADSNFYYLIVFMNTDPGFLCLIKCIISQRIKIANHNSILTSTGIWAVASIKRCIFVIGCLRHIIRYIIQLAIITLVVIRKHRAPSFQTFCQAERVIPHVVVKFISVVIENRRTTVPDNSERRTSWRIMRYTDSDVKFHQKIVMSSSYKVSIR